MTREPRPTLVQIAELTGFSPSTVSRALKRDPRVSPATLKIIQNAAEKVGFTQNALARSLRAGGSSALIGVLVPYVLDPFFAAIASTAQTAASRQGREVLLGCHNNDPSNQTRLISQMVSHRIEALIIAPAPGPLPQILIREANYGTSLVVLDRPSPDVACDVIITDNRDGARSLTTKLLEHGHRRFMVPSMSHVIWTQQERFKSVRETLNEAGIPLHPPDIVQGESDGTMDVANIAASLSSPDPPTGVVALSIRPLLETLRVANQLGVKLEYACFDSNDFFDLLPHPVWCVNQDPTKIGSMAVEMVLRQSDDPRLDPVTVSLPLSKLSRRGGVSWNS